MHILFNNGDRIDINLNLSPLSGVITKMFKHLQNVDIPFRIKGKDNPYYIRNSDHLTLVDNLCRFGKAIGIEVDHARCLAQDQSYYNYLHQIYEKNYDGTPEWLDYHEHIHLCETRENPRQLILHLDYREKAGLLEKKFDNRWLQNSKSQVSTGDVFISWSELGKTPYTYWKDNEPNDIVRICGLAKPWIKLRPKLLVALDDIDFLEGKKIQEFESWWKQYHHDWCNHWGLESWTIHDIYGKSTIGKIADIDRCRQLLENNIYPTKVRLA